MQILRSSLFRVVLAAAWIGSFGCKSTPSGGDERGEYLFGYCVTCHGEDGGGKEVVGAPAIAGMDQWYLEAQLVKFRDGHRGAHPDDEAGLKMRPMMRILRKEGDLKTVAAYVASMPRATASHGVSGGDANKGAGIYAPCIACHGPDGKGNQALKAPPLKGQADWYLLAQLKKFKKGIRGTNPNDVTGAQMRGMTLALTDEQAMRDVIAHIRGL